MVPEAQPISPEQALADDLIVIARRARDLGLIDYAGVLDALADGALLRLELAESEPVPFTVVD
jgi:hypothetical protein